MIVDSNSGLPEPGCSWTRMFCLVRCGYQAGEQLSKAHNTELAKAKKWDYFVQFNLTLFMKSSMNPLLWDSLKDQIIPLVLIQMSIS